MSAVGQVVQQLQKDLQNELTTTNQLLRLIGIELQQIRHFTGPGGEFEENLKQNASLTAELGKLQRVNFDNLLPVPRTQIGMDNTNQPMTMASEQQDISRNNLQMDSQ